MSTNTMIIHGLDSDTLYVNKQEFLNLTGKMISLHNDDDETDLRNLLQLVRVIMDQPSSVPQPKEADKLQKTFSNSRLTGFIRPYANSILKQIGNKESKEKEEMAILEQHTNIPLTTQGILALVAFATMYGRFRLLKQQVAHGSSQLAKSIALLKQQPDTLVLGGGPNPNDEFNKWSESIDAIFKPTLDLADQILDMKSSQILQSEKNTLLHFTAILRILMTVVLCYSQVETVLIKHSRKEIPNHTWDIQIRINVLKEKRGAIERLLSKDSAHQPSPIVEAPRSVPQRSASFYNCWMKFGHLINTTSTIKSQKQIKSFNRTNSLPDTHLMFSEDVQGALLNKEPAYKEAM
ncbi:hypothetical protein ACJIZ3_006905 [Penstemon smallii]|uniref:Sieve element occlusion N-terminal domain-containing protein n=1 Tax=Penstemon smallii TaxID=265156 RepID=A0ABD3S918_9LAMI